jgi:hypothetical protein
VIESVNGVIMCFDAFGDLIEYMLEPLSGAHSFVTLNEIENQ